MSASLNSRASDVGERKKRCVVSVSFSADCMVWAKPESSSGLQPASVTAAAAEAPPTRNRRRLNSCAIGGLRVDAIAPAHHRANVVPETRERDEGDVHDD